MNAAGLVVLSQVTGVFTIKVEEKRFSQQEVKHRLSDRLKPKAHVLEAVVPLDSKMKELVETMG